MLKEPPQQGARFSTCQRRGLLRFTGQKSRTASQLRPKNEELLEHQRAQHPDITPESASTWVDYIYTNPVNFRSFGGFFGTHLPNRRHALQRVMRQVQLLQPHKLFEYPVGKRGQSALFQVPGDTGRITRQADRLRKC